MFFDRTIRSKLCSLLRPWLREEPELELKLGLLRSHGSVENLHFDNFALNQLIDETSCLSFENVRVRHMTVGISYWSVPAFSVDVHGVDITLSVRKPVEETCSRQVPNWTDSSRKEMNEILSVIDPQGTALHENIGKISVIDSARNQLTNSFLNVILKHCRLQMHDIHLEVQLPVIDGACSLKIKELSLEGQSHEHACLLRGLVGALFVPQRDSSLVLNGRGLEIRMKREDHVNCVFASWNLFTSMRLINLQVVDVDLCIPELNSTFSPADLAILIAFDISSSKTVKYARNGKELWKTVARRIDCLTSSSRFSFHKLVDIAGLWLRHVRAYESLLFLVGHSSEKIVKRSAIRMSQDRKFASSVKHQWKVISEIEKKLPIETVARARRIARHRAALHVQRAECNNSELVGNIYTKFFSLLSLVWKMMSCLFYSITRFLFLSKVLDQDQQEGLPEVVSQDSSFQRCFSLYLGKFSITLSPASSFHHLDTENLGLHIQISHFDLFSFCLATEALFLTYATCNTKQSLSLACGDLKVIPLSYSRFPIMKKNLRKETNHSFKEHIIGRINDSGAILWSEPAPQFVVSEDMTDSADSTCTHSVLLLENHLEEIWLKWKRTCKKIGGSNTENLENPFLLCEIKSSLMDPCFKQPDYGLLKCVLTMGKLNCHVGYSSVMSIALIQWQLQHSLLFTRSNEMPGPNPLSVRIDGESTEIKWNDYYESCSGGMKMVLLRVIPEKNIEVGVLVAGANIRLSLKEGMLGGREQDVNHVATQDPGDLFLGLDLHGIDFAVWPTSRAESEARPGEPRLDGLRLECRRLKRPRPVDIPKADPNDNYVSQRQIVLDSCLKINGLNVYLEDFEKNLQCQVFVLPQLTFQCSSCRDFFYSFTTSFSALSVALCMMITGFTVLSYIDELSIFFKVVEDILAAVSYTFTSPDSDGGVNFQEFMQRDLRSTKLEANGDTSMSEAKGVSLILKSTQLCIDATVELRSLDLVLHDSRRNNIIEKYMKAYGISSYKKLTMHDVAGRGIATNLQQSCIKISWEEGKLEVLTELAGIQSVIFQYWSELGHYNDLSELKDLLHQSPNSLYEFSLSSCALNLWATSDRNALALGRVEDGLDRSSSDANSSCIMQSSPLKLVSEMSNVHSSSFNHEGRSRLITSNIQAASPSLQLLITVELGEFFMGECALKKFLLGAHKPKKLFSQLSICGEFRAISWKIQGGHALLETTALSTFVHCFTVYFQCIVSLSSMVKSWVYSSSAKQYNRVEPGNSTSRLRTCPIQTSTEGTVSPELSSETCNASPETKWELLKAFTIRYSEFYLVFVATDESSGGVWELVLEADFHLNLEYVNLRRKILFDLSRLTILSLRLHESFVDQRMEEFEISHFPFASSSFLSHSPSGDPALEFHHSQNTPQVFDEASSSSPTVPPRESSEENTLGRSFPLINHMNNCILKHAKSSLLVEKAVTRDEVGPPCLKHDWVGCGSISGFDFTISLSDIQMLFSILSPLSGVFSGETAGELEEGCWSQDLARENDFGDTIPDGAIVAIQDVHQHMYLAVEAVVNKYQLVGVLHYSLVGERAMFRVKHCKQRTWFFLISMHAKSDSGEPLRLNYRPGSDFIDISSASDSGALWRILTYTYNPESCEDDNDLEPYNQRAKNTFQLVNKKSNCAVAFVDGVPEFVRKPGHPIKMKVFSDFSSAHEVVSLNMDSAGASVTNLQDSHVVKDQASRDAGSLQHIDITIDKVTLTVVHELSDANDRFPLIQCCIDNIQLIVQILSSKFRLISTLAAVAYYFDAQRNSWREMVYPVDMCIYYRSRFALQGSETVSSGVPVHFYFRVKQVDISLTELSLDIILFMVGVLKLAGPYAVKSSMIFANCCKVENRSGLSLICHFCDNQDAIIAAKQCASIFLRSVVSRNQLPENKSFVAIQLAMPGLFSTSPIHVSLSNARVLAWRTRILSLQDSRTFPGPFVVVDFSNETEDGLSITVSPLLKIHNETGFSLELRFRRPQQKETESASVLLRMGDTIDDSMASFDAIKSSGGSKKALISLGLGNFLCSFRPEIKEYSGNSGEPVSVEWSEDLEGGKAVRLFGIFDKLNYKFRKTFGVDPVKYSLSTAQCSLSFEGGIFTNIHFLIQSIGRRVPVIKPFNFIDVQEPVALQEQKEIILLPTVQVCNLLQTEIHVLLTEKHPDLCITKGSESIGKQATLPCGSTSNLYANPAIIYFTITLTAFNSSCKPVNSGDWVKKLHKQKTDVHYLDIDLDFNDGKLFASLRLSRGERGILEATIYTPYTLHNSTDLTLFCFQPFQNRLSREGVHKFGFDLPPELGLLLPPRSSRSWFFKSNRVHLKLLEENASEAQLDLDVLSGFTEVCLEVEERADIKRIAKLGLSLKPCPSGVVVPSQVVSMVPRYVLFNESLQVIIVRQCYLEDHTDDVITVNSNEKLALQLTRPSKRKEISFFDSLLRKHRNANDDSQMFIQFRLNEDGWSWSGPICIGSLGRFFLKFRRSMDSIDHQSNSITMEGNKITEFAAVHVVEEGSTLVLHFHKPPNVNLPYRIENLLDAPITYYQKNSLESEFIGPGKSVDYVWDDLNLPHKLIIQISGLHLLCEINMDKIRAWRPFFKRQHRGLGFHLPLEMKLGDQRTNLDEPHQLEMSKMGFEVYADGPTRVLRLCKFSDGCKEDSVIQPRAKIRLRVSYFSVHLFENRTEDVDASKMASFSPLLVVRLGNINVDSMFTAQHKYNQIRVQSVNVDEKWIGAPFAAVLRRNQLDYSDIDSDILRIVFILLSTNSNVTQVKYSSILLQPMDLNLDEETLMRLVPFWRTSLSDSNAPSRQFYFKHFEIHPVKIVATFLPGDSYSSYTSSQETLRSLLHSVIKIPTVKKKVVELNGVLVTHALVTVRELFIKCARHYSWYALRAIYIAKGSPLLPPAFASIFDDSASSSLDVFFDPSSGFISLPGFTIGMFKFISKCIDKKGFSGTKRYFGDLGKTMRTAGSNILFAAVTEISDSVLKGAEASGFNGMVNGFHQGILKLAMEPSLFGTAFMEGGPDRKIKLDQSPGVDELYIEGYLQAMLDTIYKQEYLRVRVIENQVVLKNLPPNSTLINKIMDRMKSFLVSKGLLKGESSTTSRSLHHLQGESEWKLGPTVMTLCEHLFVRFAIRMLREQSDNLMASINWKKKSEGAESKKEVIPVSNKEQKRVNFNWIGEICSFVFSGMIAYVNGRLCRCIPNSLARRIVSGFFQTFLDKKDNN
ncbi:uncharacterized protein LOC122658879 isoform X2 [Telopea speciosissima]|uniref:uncharacterized protein LOC122658879 isoform X2 n=1 Tax=Telopea speciosissima TaxID=54955 RepID=UPI001CC53742|nr:uncharacterized protein LOC122658879 isoform X2 [Telopea speciosissima]